MEQAATNHASRDMASVQADTMQSKSNQSPCMLQQKEAAQFCHIRHHTCICQPLLPNCICLLAPGFNPVSGLTVLLIKDCMCPLATGRRRRWRCARARATGCLTAARTRSGSCLSKPSCGRGRLTAFSSRVPAATRPLDFQACAA